MINSLDRLVKCESKYIAFLVFSIFINAVPDTLILSPSFMAVRVYLSSLHVALVIPVCNSSVVYGLNAGNRYIHADSYYYSIFHCYLFLDSNLFSSVKTFY